jgi:hypothetical protein
MDTQSLKDGSVVATVHPSDAMGLRLSAGGYLADEFARGGSQPAPTRGGEGSMPKRGSVSAAGEWKVEPGVEVGLYATEPTSVLRPHRDVRKYAHQCIGRTSQFLLPW